MSINRRKFIQSTGFLSSALILPLNLTTEQVQPEDQVTFGLVADAHQDIMHDAIPRLEAFIQATLERETDFNIQIGDFCEPKAANLDFFRVWNQYKGPKHHVLGNHDMDSSTKEVTIEYWGMEDKYYSFDLNGFHFVVLDANYLNLEGQFVDYSKANFYIDSTHRTWINPKQIEWLEDDLQKTDLPTLVFSHQGLAHDAFGIKNRTRIQKLFEAINKQAGKTKVIACFNGHNHVDAHRQINGIHYIDINSLSYQWLGEKYQCFTRYPAELYQKKPILSKVAPYEDPLYTFITVTADQLVIEGKQSRWLGPSPEELGLPTGFYGVPYSPVISDRKFALK